jgi:hypothetical protein
MGEPIAHVLADLRALPDGERDAVLAMLSETERESIETLLDPASVIAGTDEDGESFSPPIVARIRVAHGIGDAARSGARMTAATCGALVALAGRPVSDAERALSCGAGSRQSLLGAIRNAFVRGRGD